MSSIETQLQRARRILEISYEMTSTVSLQSLLKRIVEAAVELTDSASAGILLSGDNDNELRFIIASDSAGALAGIPVPIDRSITGHVNAIKYGGRPPRIKLGADPPAALTADGGEYVRF